MSDVYDTDTSSLSSSEYTDSDTSSVSSLESEDSSVQVQRPSKYYGIYRALLVLRYICYVMWLIMFVIDFSRNGSERDRHVPGETPDDNKNRDYVQTMFNDCFLSPGTHLFWLLSVVVYFMTNKMKVSRTETLSVELLSFLCLFILVPSRRTQGIQFWNQFGDRLENLKEKGNRKQTNKVVKFIQKHENLSTKSSDEVKKLPVYKKPVVRIIQELSPPRPKDSIIKTDPVERSETLFDSLKRLFKSNDEKDPSA